MRTGLQRLACKLKRCGEILRLAENHWTVLETMSAADFQEFRPYLTGASGMQSRQFREVEVTVRSLTGVVATRTIPLSSRVEPQRTTPISIAASLVTSNPSEPGNLSGVQELIFLGRNDRGGLIRVIVRVPLE